MTDDAKTPLAVVDEDVGRVALYRLNVCCGIYVAQALEAGLVVYMADRLFHKFSAQGMTGYHPAYSMTYCALAALEAQRIIEVFDIAKKSYTNKELVANEPFRRGYELLAHRMAIAHPSRREWREPWMREFYNAGRAGDLRAAVLWDFKRSLNEATAAVMQPTITDIRITSEMAISLRIITEAFLKLEHHAVIPTPAALLDALIQAKPRYIEMLERHPDGRPADDDEEKADRAPRDEE